MVGLGPVEPLSLEDPLRFSRAAPPSTVVIFGANGDLTRRKLLPAVFRLAQERRLPASFAVVGVSRTAVSDDQFREKMREGVEKFLENSPFDADLWNSFAQGLFYIDGDIGDPGLYRKLDLRLSEIAKTRHTAGNILFYLSTQPSHYAPASRGLGAAGLARASRPEAWRRIIIEKPFGHDLVSARALNAQVRADFDEDQI